MKRPLFTFFFLFVLLSSAWGALSFPTLSGRVVDDAGILSAASHQYLENNIATFEHQSGDQIVVVTLRSLEGTTIEDYGYQLGRFWGIGQKEQNNGVILIIAPREHKVRIEVGYGLEGVLTDAQSSNIIQSIILPSFRSNKMEEGVINGTNALISVLGGHTLSISPRPHSLNPSHVSSSSSLSLFSPLILFFIFFLRAFRGLSNPRRGYGSGIYFGSGFSGGGSSGGFSGGGGSFGGGGASGGW